MRNAYVAAVNGIAVLLLLATDCDAPRERTAVSDSSRATVSGTVTIDSVSIPYRIVGAGRGCLVMGSPVYYERVFSSAFKAALRCAYVSHRGYIAQAPSPHRGPFDIDAAVEEFEMVRRSLGMERVVLIGHSIHGLIALAYALRYPRHVSHVIAIDAPPSLDAALARQSEHYWHLYASPARREADRENHARLTRDSSRRLTPGDSFVAMYVANAARFWADSTYDASWLWRGVTVNMPRVRELMDPMNGYVLHSRAPVSVPVLVVLGRHDYAIPTVLWDGYRGPFSDVTFEVFEHSGHTPPLEEPEEFDRRVLAWLSGKR